MSAQAIFILGAALALVPVIYLILAAVLRRKVQIFRWRIEMPGLLLAIAQIAVGVLNFLFVGATTLVLRGNVVSDYRRIQLGATVSAEVTDNQLDGVIERICRSHL